ALPADQSSYSKEIFGEFVQSANSPNIFSRQYSVLPGGGEPLPYGGDWAMRLFCNSPVDKAGFVILSGGEAGVD
ncbi:MAG: hypothetical protein IKH34_08385, partial [Oscillospiraceae bacterium]|nr:hypothetical protein [Oscillospiraceae bacterium]